MTISNLTLYPPFRKQPIPRLYLDNTGTIALHILDGLNFGFNPNGPSGGASTLISSNSTLVVDGSLGGQLSDDGSMVFIGGSLISTNSSLIVGVSSFYGEPGGTLILSNSVSQARDVTIASQDNGEIEVIGGSMTMTSLSINTGDESSSGNMLIANGAVVAVTNGGTSVGGGFQSTGNLTVTDGTFFNRGVSLFGGERSTGSLTINDGTVTLSGQLGHRFWRCKAPVVKSI